MSNAHRFGVRFQKLAAARDALGLTDAEVAEASGLKYSRWRGLLRGHCFLRGEELERLCEVLGVRPEDAPHRHLPTVETPPPADTASQG